MTVGREHWVADCLVPVADLGNLPRDTGSCARPEAIARECRQQDSAHAASTKYLRFADRGGDAMVGTVPEEIPAAKPKTARRVDAEVTG